MRCLLLRIEAWSEKMIGTADDAGSLRACPVLRNRGSMSSTPSVALMKAKRTPLTATAGQSTSPW
jgi:hypothetical protein